jgi:hypothetical protein
MAAATASQKTIIPKHISMTKSIKLLALVFISLIAFEGNMYAQIKNYDAQWKTADQLIQKNLPKSALTEVKKIYEMAKKEGQEAQVIKSLVYLMGLQEETREENDMQSIKDIDKEIAIAKEPALSILKSWQAGIYWQYFQNNRWKLYSRTNTVNFNKEDIATWTAGDFHKKISALYLQSIKNDRVLKQTKLDPFDAILIKGTLRYLRPTLYDVLAHQALDYFQNDERDLDKPAYSFEISQPEAFAPAEQFIRFAFSTKDSFSLQYKALLIYQDLLAFHAKDAKPDAFIDADIERISFVYGNATMENKEELYVKALETVAVAYPKNAVAAQASFLLASYYNDLASGYDRKNDTTHRLDRLKARDILERIVSDSSKKTETWVNSVNLLNEINKKEFSFQVEKVNLPGEAFRALINYKNISSLNLRLIKATEALKKLSEDGEDKFWDAVVKASSIRSWQQSLPATNDLQAHAAEIKVDGLPYGEYILLASYEQQFNKKDNPLGARLFYISDISYVNDNQDFFVLHRQTGKPLANATVQFWENRYYSKTSS